MAVEAHLQMIQTVISRLASHSTTVKGWCVTVTGALLGFGASSNTPIVAVIAFYVICAFAILDSYYLALERAYRDLFRQATTQGVDDWVMQTSRITVAQVRAALASPSIFVLYSSSLVVAAGIGIFLWTK